MRIEELRPRWKALCDALHELDADGKAVLIPQIAPILGRKLGNNTYTTDATKQLVRYVARKVGSGAEPTYAEALLRWYKAATAEHGVFSPPPAIDNAGIPGLESVAFQSLRDDIANGLLFSPLDYVKELDSKLSTAKKVLITGLPGSGKTMLAIAYALHWQRRSSAKVLYKEFRADQGEDAGERLYTELKSVLTQDDLLIVDNAHLAHAAANRFCDLLATDVLPANVILVSASRVQDSASVDDPDYYFDYFKSPASITNVEAERLYADLLRIHSDFHQTRSANAFAPIEEDFQDAERSARIRALCSHSLVVTRAALDTWSRQHGHFGDIALEDVLDTVTKRYFRGARPRVLGILAALGQLDIPAHGIFLNTLDSRALHELGRDNLTISEDLWYGTCSRLILHTELSHLVWLGHLRHKFRNNWRLNENYELFVILKGYLMSRPENFRFVYRQLHRSQYAQVQRSLIVDQELVHVTSEELERRGPVEAIGFLHQIHRLDPDLAAPLLERYLSTSRSSLIDGLYRPKLNFTALNHLMAMDESVARDVVDKCTPEEFAIELSSEQLANIQDWIAGRSKSPATRLGLDNIWRESVVARLDLKLLAWRIERTSPTATLWFLRDLEAISPTATQELYKLISPVAFAKRINESGTTVSSLLNLHANLPRKVMFRLVSTLEPAVIFEAFDQCSLDKLGWFIRNRYQSYAEVYEDYASTKLRNRFADAEIEEISRYLEQLRLCQHGHGLAVDAVELVDIESLMKRPGAGNLSSLFQAISNISQRHLIDMLGPVSADTWRVLIEGSSLAEITTILEIIVEAPDGLRDAFSLSDLGPLALSADSADVSEFLWAANELHGLKITSTPNRAE